MRFIKIPLKGVATSNYSIKHQNFEHIISSSGSLSVVGKTFTEAASPFMHWQLITIQHTQTFLSALQTALFASNALFTFHPSRMWSPSQPRTSYIRPIYLSPIIPHPFSLHAQTITTLPALLNKPTLISS